MNTKLLIYEQKLNETKAEIMSVNDLQTELIRFNDENDADKEITFLFIKSNFNLDKRKIQQLLFSIDSLVTFRKLSFENAFLLIKFVKNEILSFFSPNELIFVFEQKRIILFLLEENVITIQSLLEEACESEQFFFYFYPEIKQENTDYYYHARNKYPFYRIPPDESKHDKLRKDNENEHEIARLIRSNKINEFISYFVENRVDVNDTIPHSLYEGSDFVNDETAMPLLIEYAAFYSAVNIFKFLILEKAVFRDNLVYFAAAGGNPEILYICEEKGLLFDEKAMRVAIQFHQNSVVEYLKLTKMIRFNKSHLLCSILSYNCDYFMFDLLSKYIAKINKPINGEPILVNAVNRGYSEIIELIFLEAEGNIFKKGEKLVTIDMNLEDFEKFTALEYAVLNNRIDLVKFLLQYQHEKWNLNQAFRFSAHRLKRKEIFEFLLNQNVDVNGYYMKYGLNSLLAAIENDNIEVIEIMVKDIRFDLNACFRNTKQFGDTALMFAIRHKKWQIVDILLESGRVDVDLENEKGETAMSLACKTKNKKLISLLTSKSSML